MTASLTFACSGSQSPEKKINERWQWDGGAEASRLMSRLNNAAAVDQTSAVVGVTGFGLTGKSGSAPWNFEAPVDVLPTILGDTVLFTGEGMLYAVRVMDGSLRFKVPSGGRRLEGAGFDGRYFILLLVDQDDARQDQIRVLTAEGKEVTELSVRAHLGTPAIMDGVALIPYGEQYVAGFEVESGRWLGRLLYRDALHSVTADRSGALVWGRGVTELSAQLTSDPESKSLVLPLEPFPGTPVWPIDGSKPRPARAAPISILAHPVRSEGRLGFAQNTYLTTYYQIILAQEVGSHELLWVNYVEKSISGAALSKTQAKLCLEDGSILGLDLKTGSIISKTSLDARVKACVVSATDEGTPLDHERPPLRDQIVETVSNTGPDMAKVQTLLLDKLALLQGKETTLALLAIAQDPMTSSELARHAGNLLSTQRAGGEEMVKALLDFTQLRAARLAKASKKALGPAQSETENAPAAVSDEATAAADGEWMEEEVAEDDNAAAAARVIDPTRSEATSSAVRPTRRPPPVGAIAVALNKLKTPGAAAALGPYLSDPSLSAREVKAVMNAVFELGGPQETEYVHQFVLNYKNTGGEDDLLDALAQGLKFLLIHLAPEQRDQIKAEINESLTHPDLKKRARQIKIRRVIDQKADEDEEEGDFGEREPKKPAAAKKEGPEAEPKDQ